MSQSNASQLIAIVGLSCRFPGADKPQAFWENLKQGVESIEFLSDAELTKLGLDAELVNSPNYVNAVSRLQNIDLFDAEFWGLSPAEAQMLDPQQRLLLELAQESFDDAAFDPKRFSGRVGVFSGIGKSTYLLNNISRSLDVDTSVLGLQVALATDKSYASTRVSYVYNLDGPSLSVDTACSTSLVAVHYACRSLLEGECDAALAGGAQVNVPHASGYKYSDEGIFSKDGHCRPFDVSAQGTIFGNGGALLLLKRLDDALSAKDQIYGVIRGTASANDGASKVGFIAPGFDGQQKTLNHALMKSGIAPETVGYLEAHGSGTALGDVIEVSAAASVYGEGHAQKQFCAIGSVKSNIGHLETAAGIAGLTKAVLSLKHKKIPATLNFSQANPEIDFPSTPFYVNTELRDWPSIAGQPRRGAVTSIGLGGTNAHVVLEEAPAEPQADTSPAQGRTVRPLFLSAKTDGALHASAKALGEAIQPDTAIDNVAFTLSERIWFDRRLAIISRDTAQSVAALRGELPGDVISGVKPEREQKLCFMFPGQGSQHINMLKDVYETEAVFKTTLDRCCDILQPLLDRDLKQIIYPQAGFEDEAESLINQTQYTQPALFSVSYSLATLWMSWGVVPHSAMGHSVGEFVAACLAGVFSLEDALKIMVERGRLMHSCAKGAMASVPLSEAELSSYLNDKLHLGAVNAPNSCVVSGTPDAVEILVNTLQRQDIKARKLHISIASHSPLMDEVLDKFHDVLATIPMHRPSFPIVSNVTGQWAKEEDLQSPQYWVNHLRKPVRFAEGVVCALENPDLMLLEVGPAQSLSAQARQAQGATGRSVVSSARHPKEQRRDDEALAEALARLWVNGLAFDSKAYFQSDSSSKLSLPTYPFHRKSYWIAPPKTVNEGKQRPDSYFHDVANWYYQPTLKERIAPGNDSALAGAKNWLIFMDALGLGEALAQLLEQNAHHVQRVYAGDAFAPRDDGKGFYLRPAEKSDYDNVFAHLEKQQLIADHIVHLWNLGETDQPAKTDAKTTDATALDLAFFSPLYLTQALAQSTNSTTRVSMITSGACDVAGEGVRSPEKSLVLGVVRTAPIECPQIICQHVDMDVAANRDFSVAAKRLVRALGDAANKEIIVRGARQWQRTFAPVSLQAPGDTPMRLRDQGVYLITGGLGGIGLAMAEAISEQVNAHIVLVSRTRFPEREEWGAFSNDNQPHIKRQIDTVRGIEARGSRVHFYAADVSQEAEVIALRDTIAKECGEVNGIIHSAGMAGEGLLVSKTRERAEAVLRPKYFGTKVLDEVFTHAALDFIVLNSSLFAISGGLGQVDYCAANAFLDAYAQHKSALGIPTVAINWDGWNETGIVANLKANASQATCKDIPLYPNVRCSSSAEPNVFETLLDPEKCWVLSEHRIDAVAMLPGTGYFELVYRALARYSQPTQYTLENILFLNPLHVTNSEAKALRLILEHREEKLSVKIESHTIDGWKTHFVCDAIVCAAEPVESTDQVRAFEESDATLLPLSNKDIGVGSSPVAFGERWHSLQMAKQQGNALYARYQLPAMCSDDVGMFLYHPAILDMAAAVVPTLHRVKSMVQTGLSRGDIYLPMSYQKIQFFGRIPSEVIAISHLRELEGSGDTFIFDTNIYSSDGQQIARIEGLKEKRHAAESLSLGAVLNSPNQIATGAFVENNPVSPGINTCDGKAAFLRILDYGQASQIAVMPGNLSEWLNYWEDFDPLAAFQSQAEAQQSASNFAAPRNDYERAVATIWQDIIGIERVGIHDNFFQLGGHSLYAIQVVGRIRERFGVEVSVEALFETPTVEGVAHQVELELSRESLLISAESEGGMGDEEYETLEF